MEFPDYYRLLGIPIYATQEEIRTAYLNQVRYFHPDVGKVSPEIAVMKTQILNEAYSILSDVQKKRAYDEQLTLFHTAVAFEQGRQFQTKQESNPAEAQTSQPPYATIEVPQYKKRKGILLFWGFIVLLIIALYMDYFPYGTSLPSGTHTTSTNIPAKEPEPESKPMPLDRPFNGRKFVSPNTSQICGPFKVKTKAGEDYYIKMVNVKTHVLTAAFYVRGGMSVELEIPLGTYELKYACGTTWYGTSHYFGDDTSYAKADDLFVFRENGDYVEGWTVELYQQTNGNLSETKIDKENF